MGTKISALPEATVSTGADIAVVQGGVSKKMPVALISSGAAAWEAPGSQPLTMADDAEVTLTHSTITNEMYDVLVRRNTGQTGLTNIDLDFDVGDAGKFTYAPADIDFAGGLVGLKGSPGSSFPTANLALSLNNTLDDSSASPATMTASGIGYSTDVPTGYSGKSLSVDTTSGLYVKANPRSRSDIGGSSWTICFWHKFTANGATIRNILDSRNANGSSPWVLYDKADTALWIWDGSSEVQIGNAGLFSSGWHHYAIVRNGSTLKVYKDGTLHKTTTVSSGTWPPNGDNTTVVRLFTNVAEAQPFTGLTRDFVIAPSELWTSDFTPPGYTADVYPTGWISGDRSTVRTTDASQFSLASVSRINSITVTKTETVDHELRWAVSFDDRATWVTWNGASWEEVDLNTTDKSGWAATADLEDAFSNWVPTTETTIDFCAAFKTSDATSTPKVSLVSINYDETTKYDPCTVGSYTSTSEFGISRVSPTQTKVKNMSGAQQQVFVHFIIP